MLINNLGNDETGQFIIRGNWLVSQNKINFVKQYIAGEKIFYIGVVGLKENTIKVKGKFCNEDGSCNGKFEMKGLVANDEGKFDLNQIVDDNVSCDTDLGLVAVHSIQLFGDSAIDEYKKDLGEYNTKVKKGGAVQGI